jgi:hypothetical protein
LLTRRDFRERRAGKKNGVRVIPDAASAPAQQLPKIMRKPPKVLDAALDDIAARHGKKPAAFVAMQLEYPREQSRFTER